MPLPSLTFRRDLDRSLHATEFDGNTDNLDGRIGALESSPPEAVSIDDITQDTDGALTVLLTDATTRGPFSMPAPSNYVGRGAWAPSTLYAQYNTVTSNGRLYSVEVPHTSDVTFDSEATDGMGHKLYRLMFEQPNNSLPTGGAQFAVLTKVSGSDYDTAWSFVDALDVSFSPPTASAIIADNVAGAITDLEEAMNALTFTNIGGLTTPTQRRSAAQSLGTTGTVSLDPTLADIFTVTPSGDITFNAASAIIGLLTLVITTSGTSSRTITFGTNFKSTGTLATGTVSGKVFTITFAGDGTNLNEVSRTTAM